MTSRDKAANNLTCIFWYELCEPRFKDNFYTFANSWDVKNNCRISSQLVANGYDIYRILSRNPICLMLKILNFSPTFNCDISMEHVIRSSAAQLSTRGWQKLFDMHLRQVLAVWSYHKLYDCLTKKGLVFMQYYTFVLTRIVWLLTGTIGTFSPLSFCPGSSEITQQNHVFTIIRKSVRLLYCTRIINYLEEQFASLSDTDRVSATQYFRRLSCFLHVLTPEYKPKVNNLKGLAGRAVIQNIKCLPNTSHVKLMPCNFRNRHFLVFPTRQAMPECVTELPKELQKYVMFRQHLRTKGNKNCYHCSNLEMDFLSHRNVPYHSIDHSTVLTTSLKQIFVQFGFAIKSVSPYDPNETDHYGRKERFL